MVLCVAALQPECGIARAHKNARHYSSGLSLRQRGLPSSRPLGLASRESRREAEESNCTVALIPFPCIALTPGASGVCLPMAVLVHPTTSQSGCLLGPARTAVHIRKRVGRQLWRAAWQQSVRDAAATATMHLLVHGRCRVGG